MIDSHYRTLPQQLLVDPLVQKIATHTSLSPLHLTGGALVTGVLILPCLALGFTKLAFCLLLLSGYLDVLDGSLARYKSLSSPQGAAFDIVSDRAVEFAIICGLFLVDPSARALSCICMLGSVLVCVSSFLVVGIFEANESHKSFHYSPGLMERTEAFLFFGAMIIFPQAFTLLAITFIVLVSFTAFRRLFQFHKQV